MSFGPRESEQTTFHPAANRPRVRVNVLGVFFNCHHLSHCFMLSEKLEFDLYYNRQPAAKQTKAAIEAQAPYTRTKSKIGSRTRAITAFNLQFAFVFVIMFFAASGISGSVRTDFYLFLARIYFPVLAGSALKDYLDQQDERHGLTGSFIDLLWLRCFVFPCC